MHIKYSAILKSVNGKIDKSYKIKLLPCTDLYLTVICQKPRGFWSSSDQFGIKNTTRLIYPKLPQGSLKSTVLNPSAYALAISIRRWKTILMQQNEIVVYRWTKALRFHSMLNGVFQANYQGVKIPNEHISDQRLLILIIIEPTDYSRTNMTTQSFSCRKTRMADRWSLIQLKACFYSLIYSNLWNTVFLLVYIRTRSCGT